MKLQLSLYQGIFDKRYKNPIDSNHSIQEHRIGEEIAKNFVYFYRGDNLSVSLFWTRELLYWKGWASGDLLAMWCTYWEKDGGIERLVSSKILETDKPYCSQNLRQSYENTLQNIDIKELNWFLYYAYLWHDILYSEEQHWTIDKGELVPSHNEEFLSVRESTSKPITNRNFKKHIQTGLVTEKPSNDEHQRNISLSKEKVQWFLENYYINLLVVADRNYVEDDKETVLLLYNWLQIYEDHEDKFLYLKESFLQSIEKEHMCE